MENNSNVATANNNELVKIEQFDKTNINKDFIKIGKTNALLNQMPSVLSTHQASSYYKLIVPPGTTGKRSTTIRITHERQLEMPTE
ncbi:MAG: hypothetical protein HN392_01000, partial [Anaerolineae bacterium]|nr:hypothetical protein [Anaerolineae bacterium]